MSLQFPTNPTLNQQYTASNGVTYQWDGTKWVSISAVLPAGTNSISNNGNVVQVTPDGSLQLPTYALPNYSGSVGQVLGYNGSAVAWVNTSVTPGGYTGSIGPRGYTGSGIGNKISAATPITIESQSLTPFWVAEHGGFGAIGQNNQISSYEFGTSAAYDSKGNLYVIGAGFGYGLTNVDSFMIKYDARGNLVWHKAWHNYTDGANCGATNVAIAIDSSDSIYWVANVWGVSNGTPQCYFGTMDTDGNLFLGNNAQESIGLTIWPSDLSTSPDGGVILVGTDYNVVDPNNGSNTRGVPVVIKFVGGPLSGEIGWSRNLLTVDGSNVLTDGSFRAVATDANNNIYAVGDYDATSGSSSAVNSILASWKADGTFRWTQRLTSQVVDIGESVACNNGFVYTVVNDNTYPGVVVSKFSADDVGATLIWAAKLAVGSSLQAQDFDIVFDSANNPYVVGLLSYPTPGSSPTNLWITKLNDVDGTLAYARVLGTSHGVSMVDGTSDPLVGHRVASIYQDRLAVTAMTTSNIVNDNTGYNPRTIIAQLPLDGSLTGTYHSYNNKLGLFNNIDYYDATSNLSSSCSTFTYSVTSETFNSADAAIGTGPSNIARSYAVEIWGDSSITVDLGTTSSTYVSDWIFDPANGLTFPDGSKQLSAASDVARTLANGVYSAFVDQAGTFNLPVTGQVSNSSDGTPHVWKFNNDGTTTFGYIGSSSSQNMYPGYTFPNTHGAAGQVLVDDGAGNLSWATGGSGNGYTGSRGYTGSGLANPNQLVNGSYTATLDASGNFIVPGTIESPTGVGSVVINSNDGSTTRTWTFGTDGTLILPTVLAGDTSIGTAFNTNPPGHTLTLKHNGGVGGGSGGELKFDYGTAEIKVVKDAGTTQIWTFGADGNLELPGSLTGDPVSIQGAPYTITISDSGGVWPGALGTYTRLGGVTPPKWAPDNYNPSSDSSITYDGGWKLNNPSFPHALYVNTGTLTNPSTTWNPDTQFNLGSGNPTGAYTYDTWTFGSDGALKLPGSIYGYPILDGVTSNYMLQVQPNNTLPNTLSIYPTSDNDIHLFENSALQGGITLGNYAKSNISVWGNGGTNVSNVDNIKLAAVNSGTITLETNANTNGPKWVFGVDGRTVFPVSTAPTHSYGAPGDKAGMVAFDNGYFYYCIADYVASTGTSITVATDYQSGTGIDGDAALITSNSTNQQIVAGWTITFNSGSVPQLANGNTHDFGSYLTVAFDNNINDANAFPITFTSPGYSAGSGNIWKRVALDATPW